MLTCFICSIAFIKRTPQRVPCLIPVWLPETDEAGHWEQTVII